MKFKSDIELQSGLRDGDNDIGTAGQILSSTGSKTNWIDQDSIVASEAKLVVIECKNTSGVTISKGTPVYQTGTVGATDVIEIDVADASDEDKMAAIGLLQTDLANNAFGKVVITGELLNITTSPIDGVTPVTGDTIYVKSGGGLTLTKPTGVNFIQNIGLVGKVSGGNSGSITVSSIMRSNDVPTPLYIDHTNQRLGIGATSPSQKLDVNGAVLAGDYRGSNQVYLTSPDNWIFRSTTGNERMRITSAGNVGIGTTSPTEKLEVVGNIRIDSTSAAQLFLDSAAGNDSVINFQEGATQKAKIGYDNSLSGFAMVTGSGPYSTAAMVILDSGNVGIGTTNPTKKLHIDGNTLISAEKYYYVAGGGAGFGSDASGNFKIRQNGADLIFGSGNNVGIGVTSPSIVGGTAKLTVNVGSGTSSPVSIVNGTTDGMYIRRYAGNGQYQIQTTSNSGNSGNLSLQSYGGNVGIGTTSPNTKLHISGGIIQVNDGTGITYYEGDKINSYNVSGYRIIGRDGLTLSTVSADKDIILSPTGNVGIGTTSPSEDFEVSGDISIKNKNGANPTDAGSLYFKEAGSDWGSNMYGFRINSEGSSNILKFQGAAFAVVKDILTLTRDTGRVGIGTNSPSEKLHVTGNARVTGAYYDSNNSPGTSGQILSSTVTGTDWVSGSGLPGGPYLPLAGGTMTGNINFNDGIEARFGNSADLRLYHNGTNSNIENFAGTLQIIQNLDDGDISFKSDNGSGGTTEYFRLDGGSTMNVFSKPTWQGDGVKSFYGNSQDLQIYHDGSNSYVSDTGTGSLILTGTDLQLKSAGDEFFMYGAADGQVALYHNGTKKFETGSTGVTVIGSATATTFLGDLNGTINTATTAVTKANATNDTTVATTAFVQNLIGTIPAGLVFQGTWNAATNTPTLTSGSGTTGHFYIVSTDGSTNLDGITDWKVGDWAVFVEQGASDQWEKVDNSSVLDGSGTGGSVAGWAGSGTSNTLTNAPITFSGNNTTFAGDINFGDSHFIGDDADDNLLIQGSANENIIIDSADDLILDAGGNDIRFKVNSVEYGKFKNDSSDFAIFSSIQDKDILFKGNDGGSTITALALDMSEGGNATFAGSVTGGAGTFTGTLTLGTTTGSNINMLRTSANYINATNATGYLVFRTGGFDTALTLTASQNANFAGDINIGTGKSIYFSSTTGLRLVHDGSNGNVINSTGDLKITNGATDKDIIFRIKDGASSLEAMRVDGSSNQVGIGTTSPSKKLEVNGTFKATGDASIDGTGNLFIRNQSATGSGIVFVDNVWQGGIEHISGNLYFRAGGQVDRMTIKTGGNVGIGTTSPSEKLHVAGYAKADTGFKAGNYTILNESGNETSLSNTAYYPMFFKTNNSTRMTISNAGNVGIGTTSPVYKLDVNGGARAGGVITYSKSSASLDTTGYAVAGLTTGYNGNSTGFTFTCFGNTGGYQKIVYSCYNGAGTWYPKKVIDEGTNDFDVEASANGSTITFTFKSTSGTKNYTPRVTIEATGHSINSTYA